ncbi:pyridoxal-phosphate dependent enzyme [Caldalkalibacillus salinus]|uniref:pyridoxal-phosphate dependent enzyme n=1 Tax=Caldalkalibacillus salinus TaxID=2803787 RepID=UPI001923D73F
MSQEASAYTNFPSVQDVWFAKKRISPLVKPSPLIYSPVVSAQVGAEVYIKLETVHPTGAFKLRGATNKILSLSQIEREKGVTTYSTGNHGLAVAYVARQLGIPAVICVSHNVPQAKIDVLERSGATLEVSGHSQDEAAENCHILQSEHGLTLIEPFDDPHVIAGQGTMGLEILNDLPSINKVLIPLSGGGLLAGIALALKTNVPHIHITGVSPTASPVMIRSIEAGRPLQLEEKETLADSLLGGIGLTNRLTFPLVQRFMDGSALVSEEEILQGLSYMFKHHKMVVEGAAAVGIGALLCGHLPVEKNDKVVVIISGNQVDSEVFLRFAQSPTLTSHERKKSP